ncbi:hypothetical protein F4777DRAFT_548580 [Nemania sp. FL0916]|nr:hypothetical protein F4777DRAFT_548580 [Nemania sp. FL0916]
MAPVQIPTYMLAPNWSFRPGGAIALGNIIVDPFRPHIVLNRADQEWLPRTATTIERDWRLALGKEKQITVGLWANFIQSVGFSVGGERSKNTSVEYKIDNLETIQFAAPITTHDIGGRVRDPIVFEMMRPDSFLSKPVYMVTGMKIARNFELTSKTGSRKGGNIGMAGAADGVGGVTIGGKAAVTVGSSDAYGFKAEDVVFAYQLHKIAPKGWRKHKTIRISEFTSPATFLSDGDDEADEAPEIEHCPFTVADLDDLDERPATLRSETFGDGESEDECVVLYLESGW